MAFKRIPCLTAATFLCIFASTLTHATSLPTDSSGATSSATPASMAPQEEIALTTSLGPAASVLWPNPFDSFSATPAGVAVDGPGAFSANPGVPPASLFPEGNPLPGKGSSTSGMKSTHFEIQGIAQWRNMSSSSGVTTAQFGSISLSNTLGVARMQVGPLLRFIWTPEFKLLGAKSKFWVEFGEITRLRSHTISYSFTFLGNLYVIDSTLSAQFKTRQFELAYAPRWGNAKFRIGPGFWYERMDVSLALSDVNAGQPPITGGLDFPNSIFLLGPDFDYAPKRRFDLYGHAGAVPCCGGGWHVFESELGAKYYFAHGFGVMGGVRYSYVKRDWSVPANVVGGVTIGPFSGFLKFPEWGPFVGMSWRF